MEEGNYASDKNDPVLYRKNNEKSRSFYTLGDFLCVCRAFCRGIQYVVCFLSASGDIIPDGESMADPVSAFGRCSDRFLVRCIPVQE